MISPHYSHLRKTLLPEVLSGTDRHITSWLPWLQPCSSFWGRCHRQPLVRGKTAAAPLLRYRQGTTRCLLKTLESTVAAGDNQTIHIHSLVDYLIGRHELMQIDSWFWLFWLWLDRKQWLRYGLLVHRSYLPFGWGCLCEILQQDTAIGLHDHGSRPEGIRLGGEYSWSIPGSTLLGLVQHILPWRQIICQGTWWLLVVGFVSPSSLQPLVSNLGCWFDLIWLGFTLFWCLAQPKTRLRKLSIYLKHPPF